MTEKSMGPSATTWFYKYDTLGHMTSATEYSAATGGTLQAQATFVFDALNNRVEQDEWTSATGTVVTRFAYDGQNVWADLNGSNQLQDRRLFLDSVDSIFARIDSGGNLAWYLTDHLGSVRVVMNSADTTTDVVSFDAFGNITSETNSTFGDRYKWTGRELDTLTGLQYNRARDYDLVTGRFTGLDPLGFAAGDHNLYRYVFNAPTTLVDASGDVAGLQIPVGLGWMVYHTGGRPDFNPARGFGEVRWPVTWHLRGLGEAGSIVQLMHIYEGVDERNMRWGPPRNPQEGPEPEPTVWVYFEAWGVTVANGIYSIGDGGRDTWREGRQAAGTSGYMIFRGEATYWPGIDEKTLRAMLFIRNNPATLAGSLLSRACSTTDPTDTNNVVGMLMKNSKNRWSNQDPRWLEDRWNGPSTTVTYYEWPNGLGIRPPLPGP
jgi:RHS repeat-associated protein